ncbi:two-component system response regulator YesN [Paenibacillus taihuensis]|uniref:Two-component system response regulator YesN n=1 Tax=Paenibacillus taihuensis TaxID=1156355 RepID=A0A3D9RNK6_9BACL|nr:response regulator [Paenibacillus taihuensis]REE81490.1 two-component system response regulator YesN [Paenibacillus taihuensis]
MIQVLIVDDDKLVRKGLASAMPWKEFGMEVAGEANNGENALKFMEECKIDLLITDLSMPVMSGIELMRIVRQRYPQVQIVVLTLHQDFEYVQEALRLGAIDYIAKVQLEREQFEEVLSRIKTLMGQKDSQAKAAAETDEAWTDELFVLYALQSQQDEAIPPANAMEAESGIWYWSGGLPEGYTPEPSNYALVCFRNMLDIDRKTTLQLLRNYRKSDLFYDYDPAVAYQSIDAAELLQKERGESSVSMDQIKSKWLSADWIYEDAAYEAMLQELKHDKMPPIRLARIFFSLSDEWNRLYQQILPEPIHIEDFFSSWFHFEAWLRGVRDSIREANTKPQFSKEIQTSIVKAMNLAQQNITEPIPAADIAQMVSMSSSYFSQCFKQYVGQTYTDYVRDIRMERAKTYLRTTTKTIQWIAEQIGYSDEKYFSRLFREQVGVLPSEFRQMAEN